jgi:hypothetical protein
MQASMAETRMRGASGLACSERRMRMSWAFRRGRGEAYGYKELCLAGAVSRAWM